MRTIVAVQGRKHKRFYRHPQHQKAPHHSTANTSSSFRPYTAKLSQLPSRQAPQDPRRRVSHHNHRIKWPVGRAVTHSLTHSERGVTITGHVFSPKTVKSRSPCTINTVLQIRSFEVSLVLTPKRCHFHEHSVTKETSVVCQPTSASRQRPYHSGPQGGTLYAHLPRRRVEAFSQAPTVRTQPASPSCIKYQ